MEWQQFSKKQLQLLTWWADNSPYKNMNGIIAEGAVRSGKTLLMSFSFVAWSMNKFDRQQFAICGKTVGSLRRNVVTVLKDALNGRGFKVIDRQTENKLVISYKGKVNTYYLFGGRDERSQDLIQGITLAGVLLDEVALMPRSFVEQAMARCSVTGSTLWFNCNPEGPNHWFYKELVLKAEEKKLIRIHLGLDDNLSLSEEIKDRYRSNFKGIFYRRFILGEWAFADGVVYDCYSEEKNTYTNATRDQVLPYYIKENDPPYGYPYYGTDYGVFNPQVFLEVYKVVKAGDRIPYFYVDKEYYYNSREKMAQKTDDEYVSDLEKFIGGKHHRGMIVDPSASSLMVAASKRGIKNTKANNDVMEGLRMVYSLMSTGHILINKDNCPNLISEIGLYCWDEKKGENGKELVVKKNDHALDALRYVVATTTQPFLVLGYEPN